MSTLGAGTAGDIWKTQQLLQEEGVNLSVKTVAESRGISEKYLEQIIPVLVR